MADAKVILITGANTGIGFQVARALYSADRAYSIIIAARSLSKAQDAISEIQSECSSSSNKLTPAVLDLESDESIEKAYDEVKGIFGKLDALVNNAGAQFDQRGLRGEISTREAWNKSWDVNVTGTQIVTATFIPLLLQSADPRIVFVTSGTATLEGTVIKTTPADRMVPEPGWPKTMMNVAAYRSAKTGLNMMMREWDRILTKDGVKVFAISPGLLATNLGGNLEMLKKMGAGDPAVAGALFRDVLEGRRDGDVGRVVNRDGVQPW